MVHSDNPPAEKPAASGTGTWGEASWELFLTRRLPDLNPVLCMAVGVVAIRDVAAGEVVLTLTEKGRGPGVPPRWEIPAGHIDPLDPGNPDGPRESPEQAGAREAREEAGLVVGRMIPIGYRKIHNPPSSPYPPLTFMLDYLTVTDEPLRVPTDPGPPAVGSFSIETVRRLAQIDMVPPGDLQLIEYGLVVARQQLPEPPHAS